MTGVGLAAAGPSSDESHGGSLLLAHVREALINSAAGYASRGQVRLNIVFSTPRLARDLYPFAHIDADDLESTKTSQPVTAYVEHVIMTAGYTEESQSQGRLMYALECFLYTLPKHNASLLYVSKLDSSGYGPTPVSKHLQEFLPKQPKSEQAIWDPSTSITRVITTAFLSYFASLSHWSSSSTLPAVTHISIHILARAQGAYLFPSSNDNKGKHILTDSGLIKWWRSVVSEVVCGVRRRGKDAGKIEARPFYLIPGYDRLESHEVLPLPPTAPARQDIAKGELPSAFHALSEAGWVYGHPYSLRGAGANAGEPLPSLPLSGPTFETQHNDSFDAGKIANLLPHFPDDPKSRFIAELARDSYEHVAKRKAEHSEEVPGSGKKAKTEQAQDGQKDGERGNSTSFSAGSSIMTKAMRERRALDAVSPDEFWQRMGFRQECCAGNIVGVFVTLFTQTGVAKKEEELQEGQSTKREVHSQTFALPHPILPDLIMKHLMRDACDWSLEEGSRDLTKAWDEGIQRAIKRKGRGSVTSQAVEQQELGKGVVYCDIPIKGPSAEEVTQAEEKWKANRGTDTQSNGHAGSVAAPINTLSVKRKKKV